ncbi:ABC transporter permease [Pelagibacterium lacus]|uniref:ABC transporter permease n=2 Tax=Pelagibacterium lacus TaxID=2282655 RepID=A0A369W2N6_9HYPH|nr:ABC transporter permease [Pelagibacterium lacus]
MLHRFERPLWFLGSVLVALGFIGIWQIVASSGLVSNVFLPGPDRTFRALLAGLESGVLTGKFFSTVQHMFYGWFIASLIGISLGAIIGTSRMAQVYVAPSLELLRPLPASALVPVAIAFLGLSTSMVLFIIGFGALWPMLLSTIHGFTSVEPRLNEVSRILRLTKMQYIFKIALPNAMPDILAGMRLSLTVALILAVVGEMLSGQDGLGQWILASGRMFRSPDLFAGVILLGALGYMSATLLTWFEQWVLRWRNEG